VPQLPELNLVPILPEMIVVLAAIVILLLDAVRPARTQAPLVALSIAGLLGAAAPLIRAWSVPAADGLTALGGMVAVDKYAVFFRLVILAIAVIGVTFSAHYLGRTGERRGEFYSLLLFATSGMMLLSSAADLIVVFLALEVLSLSLYVMTGFSRTRLASQEASLKYFLLGAFSSAFLLYGIAMAYGATGTTSLGGMADALSGETGSLTLALTASALLLVGFAFKVAAVPFHMWTPDVYQGAPSPVTGFMAAGTKVAGFAALVRVSSIALGPLAWELTLAVGLIAVLTMFVGSILAIAQDDVKRMLAYSSIAHAGFVLVGVAAANHEGVTGAMFYLVAYAAMILGAFGVVILVSRVGEQHTSLRSYRGLGRRSPLLAGLLAVFLLSLAGLPPTAGFLAKFFVFQAAVNAGLEWLVILAVVASVVAAYFYLRVLVLLYMQDPEPADAGERPVAAPAPGFAVGLAAAITLVLGVLPGLVLDPIQTAGVLRW
jgi:NADH-quinone oxidoreductase subunit N